MQRSTQMSRRQFLFGLGAAVAVAGTFALTGCGESSTTTDGGEAKADRADADIDWQYITADDLVKKLEAGDALTVLDIRTDDMYNAGHIKGAYHVAVFPVDTTEAEDKLREAAANLKKNDDPIVVICKSGNKGAKRTISVLQEEGIDAKRLLILEGGGDGWDQPYWTTTDDDSTVPGESA